MSIVSAEVTEDATEVITARREKPSGRPPRPPKPPRDWRPPNAGGPKAPRPPRRPPRRFLPLSPRQRLVRLIAATLAIVAFSFVIGLTIVSHLQHSVWQQQLGDTFRAQLAEGTAPVSEGTFDDVLLQDGAPVAIIEIPAIDLYQVVVEGTSASSLMSGPGHRRDTFLPGQEGVSVIFGRAAAYGGPFGSIEQLPIDSEIKVTTGQGEHTYRVMGVRYPGEVSPAPPGEGEGRLLLVSARGLPFIPQGAVYIDAELTSEAMPTGARQTAYGLLSPAEKPFGIDTSTVWALVFALQFLIAVELALLWTLPRVGSRRAWLVFAPLFLLGGLWVGYQLYLLLPNLM